MIVGYHKIPIDLDILRELKMFNYDIDFTEKSLEANRHNNLTTTYYLIMKKFIRKGGVSKAYFSGKQFDKLAIEPNERRQKSKIRIYYSEFEAFGFNKNGDFANIKKTKIILFRQ